MKTFRNPPTRPILRGLVIGLAAATLASFVAQAVPYASSVTRSGNTVSFILNHDAQGLVVLRDGANPAYPGTNAGQLSFDMTGYTSYQIIVTGNTALAWTQFVPDGTDRNFWYPTTVAINKNAASTNFGKVYICNNNKVPAGNTGAGRLTTDGVYLLRADGAAIGGPYTGGLEWTSDGTKYSRPYKCNLNPDDDCLYVTSYFDDLAYGFNEDLSVATQLIDASNKTTGQYVESVYATGSRAAGNLTVYTVDSNYNDTSRKGLIGYNIGANAKATAGDTGFQVIARSFYSYYPCDIDRDSSGNWYLTQYRAAAGETACVNKFNGSLPLPITTSLWNASSSYTYTRSVGVDEAFKMVAVGTDSATLSGAVYFFDMATGAYKETVDIGSVVRDIAFDAAGNMVSLDNSTEYARFWSPGGNTVAVTGFDGVNSSFTLIKPTPYVTVTASQPNAPEGGAPGTFTISREAPDVSQPLTVNYTMTGTATNGVDYASLPGSVVIPANQTSVDVLVQGLTDALSEPTETAILTVTAGTGYIVNIPKSATVNIVDANAPVLAVASVSPTMYERTESDYSAVTLSRNLGNTNVSLWMYDANAFTFGGTAVKDVDYMINPTAFPIILNPGNLSTVVNLITPINNSILDGNRTVIIGISSGTDAFGIPWVGATNQVTTTILDDENPAEVVLWSDNFNTDTSANYAVKFASLNNVDDYTAAFNFDYASLGLPAAPHSEGDTHGLRLNVNKLDSTAAAAGINLYPTNRYFGTNFALRFDMYLFEAALGTTEYATFGINHDAAHTNWFRSSGNGFTNSSYDGLWCNVVADASADKDYYLNTAPTVANGVIWGPTGRASQNASNFKQVFKLPPYGASGSPANPNTFGPWVEVDLSQLNNVVSLRINKTLIMQYTNTVASTNGYIMLGYDDAYDSIGDSLGVVYDNVRVVQLYPLTIVTQPVATVVTPAGSSTNLSVLVTGSTTGFTNYQWRLNGVAIAGATSPTLAFNNAQPANDGAYDVVISDGNFSVTSTPSTVVVLPPGITLGNGTGLTGGYWTQHTNNAPYTGNPTLTRLDSMVNFDWVTGSPSGLISADYFTARWVGQVEPMGTETYTFTTLTDDGARLWVNGQLLVDSWVAQSATPRSGQITLTAGNKYDLVMEYFEQTGNAVAKLYWSNATTVGYSPVPQSQLYPGVSVFPAVALTAPANGASYTTPASIPLAANVTTNNNVIKYVSFYNGATLLANVTNAPFQYSWTGAAVGNCNLSAAVVYNGGWTVRSATNTVSVIDITPAVISGISNGNLNYAGAAGSQFVLLKTTDLSLPKTGWTRVQTNYTSSGSFPIPVGSEDKAFYTIKSE